MCYNLETFCYCYRLRRSKRLNPEEDTRSISKILQELTPKKTKSQTTKRKAIPIKSKSKSKYNLRSQTHHNKSKPPPKLKCKTSFSPRQSSRLKKQQLNTPRRRPIPRKTIMTRAQALALSFKNPNYLVPLSRAGGKLYDPETASVSSASSVYEPIASTSKANICVAKRNLLEALNLEWFTSIKSIKVLYKNVKKV